MLVLVCFVCRLVMCNCRPDEGKKNDVRREKPLEQADLQCNNTRSLVERLIFLLECERVTKRLRSTNPYC